MLYLVVKPSHVGVDVDRLACSLHRPMVYIHQRGKQSFLTNASPCYHAAVGGAVFLGDVKPAGLDILRGVERPVTCKTKSYMEKSAFTRAGLSNSRVIMVMMTVPLVEMLC
jgi:hypothetical protein